MPNSLLGACWGWPHRGSGGGGGGGGDARPSGVRDCRDDDVSEGAVQDRCPERAPQRSSGARPAAAATTASPSRPHAAALGCAEATAAVASCDGGGDGSGLSTAAGSGLSTADSPAVPSHFLQQRQRADTADAATQLHAAHPAPKRAASAASTYRKLAAFAALASAAARAGGPGGLEDGGRKATLLPAVSGLHGYGLGVNSIGTAPSNLSSGDVRVPGGSIDATRSCEIVARSEPCCRAAAAAARARLVTCRLSDIPPSLRPAALEQFFGADGIDIDIVTLSSDHGTTCTDATADDAAASAEPPVGPPSALAAASASEGIVSAASWPAPGGSEGDALRATTISTETRAPFSCPAAGAAAADDAAAAGTGAGAACGCAGSRDLATSAQRLALQLDILKASAARLPPRGRTAPQSPAPIVAGVGLNRFSDETPSSTSRGGGSGSGSAALDASPRGRIHQALTCAGSDMRAAKGAGFSRNATGSLTTKPGRFAPGGAADWHPSETHARMHNIISMFERQGGELLSRRGSLACHPTAKSSPSNAHHNTAVYDGGFEDV